MRLAFEREALYASTFPFVEYGLDLPIMAELDKGIKIKQITNTEYDTHPGKVEKEYVDNYLRKLHSRKGDIIP